MAENTGKDFSYFKIITVFTVDFSDMPDVITLFRGNRVIVFKCTSGTNIEYSFNGNTVHGRISSGEKLDFGSRGEDKIWFRGSGSVDVYIYQCNGIVPTSEFGLQSFGFIPSQLGTVLSWFNSENGDTLTTPGSFESVSDDGYIGGSFVYNNTMPSDSIHFADFKHTPIFKSDMKFESNLPKSTFSFLHTNSQDYTITAIFYIYELSGVRFIASTGGLANNQTGFSMYVGSGTPNIRIGNGSGIHDVIISGGSVVEKTWNVIQVVVSSGNVELFINGTSVGSDTIDSPNAGESQVSLRIGGFATSSHTLFGTVPELIIHGDALDASGLSQIRNYMMSRWYSVPGVRHYWDTDHGITLNGFNVSNWEDRVAGFDASQGTPANQPLFYDGYVIGSKTVGAIQGASGDYLQTLSINLPQPCMQFVVVETPTTWTSGSYVTKGVTQRNDVLFSATGEPRLYAGTILSSGNIIGNNVRTLVDASFNTTNSNISVYPNGSSEYSASGDAGSQNVNNALHFLGVGSGSSFEGILFLVLLVDHIPNTLGISEINNAISDMYNIITV